MPILKPEKRGDSWRVRVYVGDKKYRSVTAATKAEAIQKAEKLQAQILSEKENPKPDNPCAELTVAEAMERYVEAKKAVLSPSTYREYARIPRIYLKDLADVKLKNLTQENVQIAISIEAAAHSAKTVRNIHALLAAALKMFQPNFVLNTQLPQRKKHEIEIPEESDVLALLSTVVGTPIDAPVHLGALCGMRMSEILGLKWSKVNFESKTIHICMAKVTGANNEAILKLPKTAAGDRTIKMLPAVEAALLRAYHPDAEYVTDLTSAAIYGQYRRTLDKLLDRQFSFHALRHYCASVMILLGIPVKYIADYLGHETEDMVNRIYGHIMYDKKDELFSRLEDYYAKRVAQKLPEK